VAERLVIALLATDNVLVCGLPADGINHAPT
jgi:hypothetical protein